MESGKVQYRIVSTDSHNNLKYFLSPALSTIPDSIMECHSLLNLDLSSNPLGEMCDGITELRQLRKLVLNDIQMEDLPPSVGK